MTDRQNQST